MTLSEREAFEAMAKFMELYSLRTKSDDIASLLSDMQFHSDGTTFDPAIWGEWVSCINEIKKKNS